jgi:hypothetical protein
MDSISVKLEHTIFNDLVEEVIQNIISSYWELSIEQRILWRKF